MLQERREEVLSNLAASMEQVKDSFEYLPREVVIGSGNNYSTVTFGKAQVDGEEVYLARKLPTREFTTASEEITKDLWFMSRFLDQAVRYDFDSGLFPRVYGLVSINGREPSIITEDLSKGNKHSLHQVYSNQDIEDLLFRAAMMTVQSDNILGPEILRPFFKVDGDRTVVLDYGTFANLSSNYLEEKFGGKSLDSLILELN